MKSQHFKIIIKQYESTLFVFTTSINAFFSKSYAVKDKKSTYHHPAYQVNVSKKGILRVLEYSNFFEMPCMYLAPYQIPTFQTSAPLQRLKTLDRA